jgi:type IV secretory pathway protease TraF
MSIRTRLAVPAAVLAATAGMAVGGVAVNAPSSAAVQGYRLDVHDCGQPYTQL